MDEMKKDGTAYVVLIRGEQGQEWWEIVSWRIPPGLSDPMLRPGWCTQLGFKIKYEKFLEFYPLTKVLEVFDRG